MIKDYIVNAAMLVAFVSVTYQIFSSSDSSRVLTLKFKAISGVVLGLLGVFLMIFSIRLPNNIVVDLRHLALFLSSISGGWISSIICALFMISFRLLLYGISKASITAAIAILILLVIFCWIAGLRIKHQLKWLLSLGLSELVSFLSFTILIDNIQLRYKVILSYCISFTVISFFLYYYFMYTEKLTQSYISYRKEAKKDFLTGLNNIRQFDNLYNSLIEQVKNEHSIISLLYIDIDFFKKVNDTYGHKEGDIVLKNLGRILTKSCRSIDIVSRNGGEEFSVVLIGSPPSLALEIAERIRNNVEVTPIELSDGTQIHITVSIGIASYPEPIHDVALLREKADMALYEAKRTGRNRVKMA